jgi:hypothetical protein
MADGTRQGNEIYFRNLPALVEGGFKSADGVGAGWQSFDYELNDFKGFGLVTGALSPAGELVLDLKLAGWHRLYFCHCPLLRVWLDGEKGFLELPGPQAGKGIRDYPMHAADLTGRRLHVAPKRGTAPKEVTFFYIRAQPCQADPPRARNLVATEDGHGVFWVGMDSSREISKYFYPYRDSDFFRVLWGVYGGGDYSANPRSKTATVLPGDAKHEYYADERTFAESLRKVTADGDDPLAVAVAAAREVGVEIHFYFRVAGFYGCFPHHGTGSQFYKAHPELRCRDEFGREVKRLSYACPEVQDHLLAYFAELMEYQPDGLCLAFNRGLPVMVCEDAVLAEFRRRYGRAPRLPEDVDAEELLVVRHELLAGFVQRLQTMLSARGKALSCIAPRNFDENRRRGLDLEMLVRRGLLESVMVGAGHEDNRLYTDRMKLPPVNQDDFEPVKRLKALGTAKIYLGGCAGHGTFWPPQEPATRLRRMRAILDAGLDGGYFWDANQWFGRDWDLVRHYGQRSFLDAALAGRIPPSVERDTLHIYDLNVDRYNPWNAY